MASKIYDKSITQLFGSIAAAQTMVEQFPFSFGVNEKGFTCSFDLLTALFELCSDKPLDEMFIEMISRNLSDSNSKWLQGIEESVKLIIETNITNLLTCEMSPIIPDRLIGGAQFLEGTDKSLNFSGEGITIPVSALDFTGVLGNCPADDSFAAKSNYMPCYGDDYYYSSIREKDVPEDITPIPQDTVPLENVGDYILVNGQNYVWSRCPLAVKDLWKHDDFNAFLWYVKHKGMYSNLTERNKLMWDNRYKTQPYTKYERKPESFFTKTKGMKDKNGLTIYAGENGIIPFDSYYLISYNENPNNYYKKRQILEVRYIDGDGIQSDSFQFRLAASNYYKTAKITGKKTNREDVPVHNKTIFQFNHDFLMSLKLYDAKTFLSQIVGYTFGQGNFTFNFSVSKDGDIVNEFIDNTIRKVLESDSSVDDCYYTFSNDEYTEMLNNVVRKKTNVQTNNEIIDEYMTIIDSIDKVSGNEVLGTKTNVYEAITGVTNSIVEGKQNVGGWKFGYDWKFELIRMIAYPLIRPLFTPKVMTLILINTEIMGNPLKLGKQKNSFKDYWVYLFPIINNAIITVKNMLEEMLFNWVVQKLTPLLTLFSLRIIMEQLNNYRILIQDMITACIGAYNRNSLNTPFNQVDYVDIDVMEEELKKTPISNTNC